MAHTVSKWALRVPDLTDSPPDIPGDFARLATDLSNVAMDTQGAIASRPTSSSGTPGIAGRYFRSTDETPPRLYRDNGTGWDRIAMSTDQRSYDKLDEQVGSGVAAQSISFQNIPQTYRHLRIEGVAKCTATGASAQAGTVIGARYNLLSTKTINGIPNISYYSSRSNRVDGTGAMSSSRNGDFTSAGGFPAYLYTGLSDTAVDRVNTIDETQLVGSFALDIFDYAATDRYKMSQSRSGVWSVTSGIPAMVTDDSQGVFADVQAITRLDLWPLTAGAPVEAWTSKTRLALYGIS